MNNQRGSSLIESVFAMLNIGCVLTVVMTALYVTFAKTWIHFSLYEGLYCLAEDKPQMLCERTARKRIDRIIPLPSYTTLSLRKSQIQFNATIRLGQIQDNSWKNKISRRLFEYELQMRDPAQNFRKVR